MSLNRCHFMNTPLRDLHEKYCLINDIDTLRTVALNRINQLEIDQRFLQSRYRIEHERILNQIQKLLKSLS